MWSDVVDLKDFYDSQLGQVARHTIRRALRTLWPDLRGQSLLGLGFATPYLRQFQGEAERVIACMPAGQGVLHWPREGPGAVTLAEETFLPLPDYSVDRVLLVHGLESSEYLRDMLHEIWRVLTGDGRLLVVVPNRRGIWARFDRTPFGWGHPYSRTQLSRVLRDNQFTPMGSERALYIPPTRWRWLLRSAVAWERLGRRWFPTFSGVIMIEAGKQLYAASPARERPRRSRPVVVSMPHVARRTPGDEGA
ncbi:MAG: class I SAM-dependent methyltransferase [Rhodospirillales bacterium]|nr:class I SAM-dependent methyltransferase [Rhodospirillales bacterium]MDH3790143.1 class I SAM-dependent methyltransferase [Rhodospirillales bacterium]MDH3910058.1 class I SAM-dependent methyltransferase [Rhodospirillales bacterium]MDH3967539.1 class I SAM-dependent methyltransferase [Rhodospirillales bacterium]